MVAWLLFCCTAEVVGCQLLRILYHVSEHLRPHYQSTIDDGVKNALGSQAAALASANLTTKNGHEVRYPFTTIPNSSGAPNSWFWKTYAQQVM
jgi:hypothetical protein